MSNAEQEILNIEVMNRYALSFWSDNVASDKIALRFYYTIELIHDMILSRAYDGLEKF